MSVSVRTPPGGVQAVRVEITSAGPRQTEAAVERRWEELAAANPRLFDGPVLALEHMDLGAGIVKCRADSYKRLAVQPAVPTGVELLSVTGVLTALDAAGTEHVLLGRRGHRTRVYGGLWELAPSGGIDPPADGSASLEWADIVAQLEGELASETGLSGPISGPRLLCAVRDTGAFSTDLAVRGSLPRPVERLPPTRGNWEYAGALWLPVAEVPAFARTEALVGTARAVLWLLGWL